MTGPYRPEAVIGQSDLSHIGQVLDTMLDAMRVGYSDARITTSEPTRGHAKPTRIEHEGISIPLKC